MPVTPASPAAPTATADLRLDAALLLLEQSGHALPAGEPGSARWLQGLVDALCDLSSRDALTGLVNRRSFLVALNRELDRVARAGEPALLLTVDVDHFKAVNDTHGHAAGDEVLRAVARALQDSVRPMDTVARIGGEEFAIILPNCPPAFGETVAERIRRRIARQAVPQPNKAPLAVTASLGGAYAPPWVRSTASLWTERADLQLYRAKAQGRNRVCIEPTAVSQVSAEEKGLLFGTSQFQDLEP
ncbi:GGDEF domain-containing protein [Aquabacterium sp. J223]|uniref:GGDEF domain-containing protein n=1 Tax=Aquabacterium sp. J223 TaxID=2898431 RepID=UPI0021AD62C8|nr:GGDEF domain-containing protein [Aquabacterium sp. J223]UUX97925.1 GGDEF domain-containing protein [Aquabacterium sp. J223]